MNPGCLRGDKHINLKSHEFSNKGWVTFRHSLIVAILKQNVFSLNITKIPEPLPQCLHCRPRIGGGSTPRHNSYPRDFHRLLCLGEMDGSKCKKNEQRSREISHLITL